MSDDVIRRARDGDPDAWRELYETITGRLVVWLRARPSGDTAAAPEDLAADAWLVAAERIADFDGTVDQFAAWVFGIARNHANNVRRRSKRRATDPAPDVPDAGFAEDDLPYDRAAGLDWIRGQLSHLPRRQGEVIALTEVVGMRATEVSAVLGINATAVRVARHRGLARLRQQARLDELQSRPAGGPGVGSGFVSGSTV